MPGENKQPDLEWDGEDKPFVKAVEKAMRRYGQAIGKPIKGFEISNGKITKIYHRETGFKSN